MTIDRDRARSLGVPLREVTDALQVFIGSQYVNDFDFNNRAYRVYVQADQRFRAQPADLGQLYVRSQSGALVRLDNVVRFTEVTAPQVINHFNLFRSAEISGNAAPGVSSGQAIAEMERIAREVLPPGFDFAWAGQALEEVKSGSQAGLLFGVSLILVYLVLAAQYESWVLPFIILLGVPLAILGALSAQFLRGLSNDVFCQVGLVMLIGLAAKNSILIVEFAEQLREQGHSILDAALEAGRIRLRPILMTSLAFILGVLPLAIATGAGAGARNSVGTAVAGGMILSDHPVGDLHPGALRGHPLDRAWSRPRSRHRRRGAGSGGRACVGCMMTAALGAAVARRARGAGRGARHRPRTPAAGPGRARAGTRPDAADPDAGAGGADGHLRRGGPHRDSSGSPDAARAAQAILRAEALLQGARSVFLPTVNGTVTTTILNEERGFQGQVTQPQTQSAFGAQVAYPVLAASRWAQATQAGGPGRRSPASAATRRAGRSRWRCRRPISPSSTSTGRSASTRARSRTGGPICPSRARGCRPAPAAVSTSCAPRRRRRPTKCCSRRRCCCCGGRRRRSASCWSRTARSTPRASPSSRCPASCRRRGCRAASTSGWPTPRSPPPIASAATAGRTGCRPAPPASRRSTSRRPASSSRRARGRRSSSSPSRSSTRGQRRSLARQRDVALELTRIDRTDLEREIRADERIAREAVLSTARALAAARRAADQANEVVRITDVAFRAGATTNLEVIDAQRRARDAETAAAIAEDRARQARLDLLVALGLFPR